MKVGFPGCMHEQADLLNGVNDIRSGEGEILKSTSKAPVQCRIINQRTRVSAELVGCIDRGGDRIVVTHLSASNNLSSILTL